MEPLKILLLEDSEMDAELVGRMIKKEGIHYISTRVDKREEFIAAIKTFSPDIILSDHSLPQFNSMEALLLSKKLGFRGPFILVTGAVSDEFAVNCLKMGADDYVLKSNLPRLPSSIKNALKQHEIRRHQIEAEWALRRQNEELIKINKELDSFVYSVSHNLRAPLMSVLGLVHLASREDKEKDGSFSSYFQMMEHSINTLDETLHEIIDYSRNARSEIIPELVEVEQLIYNTLDKIKFLEGYDKIEKKISIEKDAEFYSDAYRLSVILTNILSNSIKYNDKKKEHRFLHIQISIAPEKLKLIIGDNGVGIKDELQDKIFNMFFRANEESDGAGLGLYIVKEVVKKLSGKIEVESIHQVATQFIIEIPNCGLQSGKGQ